MVPDAHYERVDWRSRIQDSEDYVPLEVQHDASSAQQIVDDARGIVARLYERGFADGAATALASQQRLDLAAPASSNADADRYRDRLIDLHGRVDGAMECVVDALACVVQGKVGEAETLLASARGALLGIQRSHDLAGRIRGLMLRTAANWADECDPVVADAYEEVVLTLRACLRGVTACTPGTVQACVDVLRCEAEASASPSIGPFRRAADELEAIRRDFREAHQ